MTVSMKAWFRALAAAFSDPAPAQTVAGLALLMLVLYTGYTIPQPSMIGALRWISYINVSQSQARHLDVETNGCAQPLRYGFEALMVNEFHTRHAECSFIVPSGPGYETISPLNQVCTTVGSVPGQATVDGNRYLALSFDYHYSNLWRVSLPVISTVRRLTIF